MPDPTAAAPWTVSLAWSPDQNFGAVSALNGRVALHAIIGRLHSGESHETVAAEYGLSGEEVAVLDRLRHEMGDGAQGPELDVDASPMPATARLGDEERAVSVLRIPADEIDDGFTGDQPPDPAPGEPASLEVLTHWVACALDVAALRVAVIEDDGTVSPLRRLVRCLRSAGLLDERDTITVEPFDDVEADYGTDPALCSCGTCTAIRREWQERHGASLVVAETDQGPPHR